LLNRSTPEALPTFAPTANDICVVDRLVNEKPPARRKAFSRYLTKVARFGTYLARAKRSSARQHGHMARAIAA
jgi:hypothetical protein